MPARAVALALAAARAGIHRMPASRLRSRPPSIGERLRTAHWAVLRRVADWPALAPCTALPSEGATGTFARSRRTALALPHVPGVSSALVANFPHDCMQRGRVGTWGRQGSPTYNKSALRADLPYSGTLAGLRPAPAVSGYRAPAGRGSGNGLRRIIAPARGAATTSACARFPGRLKGPGNRLPAPGRSTTCQPTRPSSWLFG